MEHVTRRATGGIIHHYFPFNNFAITPKQTQNQSRKKLDFSVEIIKKDDFFPHAFIEVKSLVNSNFNQMIDQLYDTVLRTVDFHGGNFSVFVLATKGTRMDFFHFYSFISMLYHHGIKHYKGFFPLNQLLDTKSYMEINDDYSISCMLNYISKYNNITTSKVKLSNLKVERADEIPYMRIWDLLNAEHRDYVHNLFTHMTNNIIKLYIKE